MYATYDSVAARLYFPDGSFWQMDCIAAGTEEDGGTMYPTVMQDSNGNQIVVRYQPGSGMIWNNSSTRLQEIEDVRAVQNPATGWYRTFSLTYSNDPAEAVHHLVQVTNYISSGEAYYFSYAPSFPLRDPFNNAAYDGSTVLGSITQPDTGLSHTFGYTFGSGELAAAILPYGGKISWDYINESYASGYLTTRPVKTRRLWAYDAAPTSLDYVFSWDAAGPRSFHTWTALNDPSGTGEKIWEFNSTSSTFFRYSERQAPGNASTTLKMQYFQWTSDTTGRPYIWRSETTLYGPGNINSKMTANEQTLDANGNVTEARLFDFGAATAARRMRYTYLGGASYTSRFILNRVVSAEISLDNGANWGTLAYNNYDNNAFGLRSDYLMGTPRQHDPSYDTSFIARGNPTDGRSIDGTFWVFFDTLGAVRRSLDGLLHEVQVSTLSTNYAVPSMITPAYNGVPQSNLSH